MLKCLVYNVGGELSEWYVTRDIAFDGDAQEVAEVDFSTLTDYTMTDEEIEMHIANGQTVDVWL